ncbi:hypothetical protein SARC_01572 [Sphaeroforma arctica JP610]|uniref:Uncharacterized protein n=1 Tax=Sphaeroforma arctica JP610 TaxID=667725 RepID=A0A0L0GB74_9EUKA|nr:hypothetical protein SARC_01572 [Sphaeroforma arctica JP610]KNC86250.1 hypothetical protein SARC_01572 [Sphaeroforma arctica JP610]|eukprot:XP_014160152.1 hypothetical protein SARC_01572 [Sphaeroforma arctica JP610]
MEYTQTSCGKSDLYSKAPATPLKGSNLAGNPKALAKTNSKALAKTNSEALAKTNRQDSALDEVSLQCAHTDHQEDSERRDSAFDEVYRAKPGDKSLDTNTIKELPNGDNHTQAGINDTNGAINDTAHGGGSEEDDISDTPAARRASTKPTNTTEELELQVREAFGLYLGRERACLC